MTIAELLKQVNITKLNEPIKWGDYCPSEKQGIYIVSFCAAPNIEMTPTEPQFDDVAIQKWINLLPLFSLNNKRPNVNEVKQELKRFWLPKENILYIGNTTRPLHKRIEEYYITELGEKGPHSGGQWLKTLKNINELYVHFFPNSSPETKPRLLDYFKTEVGELPFANLEIQSKESPLLNYKKKHGFKKQRES